MTKCIENKDTGNWIKYKAAESKVAIFNETEKIIAEGIFSNENIKKFEKRIKKEIDILLNEELLSGSECLLGSR